MTEHKCNSCFYMQHERDKHPCNVCDNYNKYVNRNVYINSNVPDFKPLTQAVKTWDFDDAFDEWEPSVTDNINSPKHYMLFDRNALKKYNQGIEVRDVLRELVAKIANKTGQGELSWSPLAESDYVQMMQYLMRFMDKNGIEDLKKASWYLDKLIDAYDESHS